MHLTYRWLSACFIITITWGLLQSCRAKDETVTAGFEVYAEMVANHAKPLAFHYPMPSDEIDLLWNDFETVANDYNVSLFREDALPTTLLFPEKDTEGKTIVIIYKGIRLTQYQQWKTNILASDKLDTKVQEQLARRLGRLLGYSPQGINSLLSRNSSLKDLASFGVSKQTTHLYYEDLEEARLFYATVLGLPYQVDSGFQISKDGFIKLHPNDSIHPAGQAKSTAIALLTDQLAQWYEYAQTKDIPIKYTYKPKVGGPHDGFVAIDPGGYLLEFEEFKQHPENEPLMAILNGAERIQTTSNGLSFFSTITWTYHKDILKMQGFYDAYLGFELVADQGWTKIYQTAQNSFIGLVDECRGMENYADQKAMELTWHLSNASAFNNYALEHWMDFGYDQQRMVGPENYNYNIVKD